MKMNKLILAIFLIAALFLAVSVVQADLECQISNVQLNGQGAFLGIEPGGTVELSFDYKIWEPRTVVPISAQQIVIGLERKPLYCAYHGCPGGFPDVTKGQSRFTMTAPTTPGTYVIRWMPTIQCTPDAAKDAYRNSPSLGYGMAEITVIEPDKQGICGKVYNVNLNNQGNYLEVETGEFFVVELDYDIWCWVEGGHRRQIMIGLNDDSFWCPYNYVPPVYPGLSRHDSLTIRIPEPGTYTLSWMITFCDTVGDASDSFRSRPDLRENIGTIKVTDCGNRELHCEVQYLDLNGLGSHLVTNPGESIRMCAYYSVWNSDKYPNNRQQIVVGLDDNPLYCAYNGVPGTYPGISNEDALHTFNAPTEPGTYYVMWMCATEYTCHNAKTEYIANPSLRKIIGSIEVTSTIGWEKLSSSLIKDGWGNTIAEVTLMGPLPRPGPNDPKVYYVEVDVQDKLRDRFGRVYVLYEDHNGFIYQKENRIRIFNDTTNKWELTYEYPEITPSVSSALELFGIMPYSTEITALLAPTELAAYISENIFTIFGLSCLPPDDTIKNWDKRYDINRMYYQIPINYEKTRICFSIEYTESGQHPVIVWVSLMNLSTEMIAVIPIN